MCFVAGAVAGAAVCYIEACGVGCEAGWDGAGEGKGGVCGRVGGEVDRWEGAGDSGKIEAGFFRHGSNVVRFAGFGEF